MTRSRTVGGAAVAIAVTALAIAVATNGFAFGGKKSSRSDVSRYIDSVDLVQTQMSYQLGKIMRAYGAFAARKGASPATVTDLATAAQTLRTLSSRVTAIKAPPAAAPLARLLARLFDEESGVAVDVQRLGAFLPGFQQVATAARTLNGALAKALAAVPQPRAHTIRGTKKQIAQARAGFAAAADAAAVSQANAIDAYDRSLGILLLRLDALSPPAMMAPAYRAQRDAFVATRTAGAALTTELRLRNRAHVAALSRRFSEAARIAGSVGRQRAEIAALKAYDGRVRRIGTLERRVQGEVSRLERTLP